MRGLGVAQLFPSFCGSVYTVVNMTMTNEHFYKDYSKLTLLHERVDRKPHRFGGQLEYHEESITGGQKYHNVYYSQSRELLVIRAARQVSNSAIRALQKEYPKSIQTGSIEIDFGRIIDKARSNITGSWFTGIKGQVNTVGIFGDRVNLDESFDRNAKIGQISAIYLEIAAEGQEDLVNICITRSGVIVLHQEIEGEEAQIDFIDELIERLELLGK